MSVKEFPELMFFMEKGNIDIKEPHIAVLRRQTYSNHLVVPSLNTFLFTNIHLSCTFTKKGTISRGLFCWIDRTWWHIEPEIFWQMYKFWGNSWKLRFKSFSKLFSSWRSSFIFLFNDKHKKNIKIQKCQSSRIKNELQIYISSVHSIFQSESPRPSKLVWESNKYLRIAHSDY